MLILLTIFLFIGIPVFMLVFHLVRPRFSIQGFLAVLAALAGWVMVLLSHGNVPQNITLLNWRPEYLYPISPSLLVDNTSWYFSFALTSLAVAVLLTSISQLGQNYNSEKTKVENVAHGNVSLNPLSHQLLSQKQESFQGMGTKPGWQSWASILVLTSLALVAVNSGNLLTLLLAWVAVDLLELVIYLKQLTQSSVRERIILAFSVKSAGVGILLAAVIISWSSNVPLSYTSPLNNVVPLLILAAGLRLGVIPLHAPLIHNLPINRSLGSVLRLAPAAASYVLLVRVSTVGISGIIAVWLLVFTAFAAIFASLKWLLSKDEIDGRPFLLLGISSLSISSAILNQPVSCLVWAIASLLSGGFIFSLTFRHRNLIPLIVLGIVNFSALPFTPTWQGVNLYILSTSYPLNLSLYYILGILFFISQAFLLAGFIHHALSGVIPNKSEETKEIVHVERWVWFLYPTGLLFAIISHLLVGSMLYPSLAQVSPLAWVLGIITVILSVIILYIFWQNLQATWLANHSQIASFWNNLITLEWIYHYLWRLFRSISRLFILLSSILEGEGGIIWALVLFALIFVFLQR